MDKMNADQVMYHFQHKMLPSWFYEDPKEFVGVLGMQNTALFEILSELFRRAGLENPYKAGQFSVEPDDINKNVGMIKIKFPKPQTAPLCHSAICFFDKGFKYLKFYTLEMGEDIENGFPVLCTWTEEGEHCLLGTTSFEPEVQLMECIEKYMGMYGEDIDAEYNR